VQCVLVECEPCVVVRLTRARPRRPRRRARINNQVVWATLLVVSFVVFATAVKENVLGVVVVRGAVVVVKSPYTLVPVVVTTYVGRVDVRQM
jgi:hypothetical protein